jgi:hypothetical protein
MLLQKKQGRMDPAPLQSVDDRMPSKSAKSKLTFANRIVQAPLICKGTPARAIDASPNIN